jgi:hypothetical protein
MDSTEHRLDASFAALSARVLRSSREPHAVPSTLSRETLALLEDTNHRFDKLEAAMAQGFAEERRLMLVLHEEVMSALALLDEGRRN